MSWHGEGRCYVTTQKQRQKYPLPTRLHAMLGLSEGFCSEKGLRQRTSNASVFLSLTAPALLCGSSLFAAQARKSHLFQKLKGEANSQITITFITAVRRGCFTQG